MISLDDARADLVRRLGPGARYNDPAAPAEELAWARLGTAYFARKLNDLTDASLTDRHAGALAPSRIVAEVGYEARALAQILERARAGSTASDSDPFERIARDVDLATTLPAAALRNLFRHSEVHLNVEWRDLDAQAWGAVIRLPGDRFMRVRETARIRALSIWLRAADLDPTASFRDLPGPLVDAMLAQAASNWTHGTSFLLQPTDRAAGVALGGSRARQAIRGRAADLAGWLAGRTARRLTSDGPIPSCQAAFRPSCPPPRKTIDADDH